MIAMGAWTQRWDGFQTMLARPISAASLAAFRICFGLVMAWYAVSLLLPQAGGFTLVERYYTGVVWNIPYHGFEWVRAWPEPWMSLHVVLMGLAGLGVALGCFYRTAAVTLFLSFTYLFLIEAARFNNHYYLISLLAFLLIWMPSQTRFSIDAWRQRRFTPPDAAGESAGPAAISFWPVFLLRSQLFIMYFYGGLAKIDADWLTGMPILNAGERLRALTEQFITLPDFIGVREFCYFLACGGLVFDLLIGFMLLFRRTRILALLLTLFFHATNHMIFPIGVFPFLAFAGTMIFLDPDWPERVWSWLKQPRLARPDFRWLLGGGLAVPVVGAALGWKLAPSQPLARAPRRSRLVLAFVCCWVSAQALLPLRHYAIKGEAAWTDEGHFFSWRMMLRSKRCVDLIFLLEDPAVLSFDGKEKPQIHWANWPAALPAARYVAIECFETDWRQLPALMVIHEPCLGQRIIFNPHARKGPADRSPDGCRSWINAQWQRLFNRQPTIRETISWSAALAAIEQETTVAPSLAPIREQALAAVRKAATIGKHLERPAEVKNLKQAVAELADLVQSLSESATGPLVRPHLKRTHPFAVQGNVAQPTPFLVIDDPAFQGDNRWQEFRKLYSGAPHLVFVDLGKMQPAGWQELPVAFFCHLEGKQRIVWNYYQDLTLLQIKKLGVQSFMIHQYAWRIAGEWQRNTGRRPEVHAGAAVQHNHRPPQLMIDPRVDLAGLPYQFFKHNSWIMPLEGRPPSFDERLGGAEECEE